MPLDIISSSAWKASTAGSFYQIRKSGHSRLREIDSALETYHTIPKDQIENRVRALNKLVLLAENYAETKDTTGKFNFLANRRAEKVSASDALAKQAQAKIEYLASVLGVERNLPAMFGATAITPMQKAGNSKLKFQALAKQIYGLQQYIGRGQGRFLHEDYWTEAIDPMHRNWGHPSNSPIFKEWTKKRFVDNETTLSFYRWFETLTDEELNGFAPAGLLATAYQDEIGREQYRVFIEDSRLKKLTKNGQLVDVELVNFNTAGYKTNFTGTGWCIFVISLEGELYCNNHDDISGWFHAAFMGGKPVLAAGELFVKDGVLYGMTPKSGHYKPRQTDLIAGLSKLRDLGLNISNAQIMSFALDPISKKGIMAQGAGVLCEWYDAVLYIGSGGMTGMLRTEGIQKSYRYVWNQVTSQPQAINGDEWTDKNMYKNWIHPNHPSQLTDL